MAQRNRRGAQVCVEVAPQLLQRLKEHAAAHRQPVSTLIRRWLELGLDGELEADALGSAEGGGAGLLERVAALEAAVALLQAETRGAAPEA